MKQETIELIENVAQVVVLFVCTLFSLYRAAKEMSRSWTMLTFFYGSYLLGDLYWQVCLLFYEESPQISVVSDLSWYAQYIFMCLLIKHKTISLEQFPKSELKRVRYLIPYLGPFCSAGFAVFYMQHGEILSNIIYAVILGLLTFTALCGIFRTKEPGKHRLLFILVIVLYTINHALWTSSCFWNNEICRYAYYIFDILMTICSLLFLPVMQREEKK